MKYFTFDPDPKQFKSEKDYKEYRQEVKCIVCEKQLDIGDQWRFQELQTMEEAQGRNVMAGIIHRKCVDTSWNSN